jgi:hypothetical protein
MMRERGLTFEQALNDAVRRGFVSATRELALATPTFSMGRPPVPLDHALRLAADLEDDELLRRLERGS